MEWREIGQSLAKPDTPRLDASYKALAFFCKSCHFLRRSGDFYPGDWTFNCARLRAGPPASAP
ncbi:hypothetical protein N184_30760 [Sinorhizobium sp. GL28]|jgi:hypothetical protein|nr:hypothetical protein ASE60_13730 [Ensifer sp. Root278]KSV87716.1 hypothetical protein N184_30760 [Sinorhizobium sp. GL28]